MGPAWAELLQRAAGNVFMDPAALSAARTTNFARIHVLLAWEESQEQSRLVGLWALQERCIFPLGPRVLAGPPYDYAFLSNPVVDPSCCEAVIAALFGAIEREPSLPGVLRLKYLDTESDTGAAVLNALAGRGGRCTRLCERLRPHVSRTFGLKRSGSTRKKLRQDWNRLSASGPVDVVNARADGEVTAAFETFLAMEAASWKGANGTALLSDEEDAIFARQLLANLSAQQRASVALLRIGERPIAAQVLFYCGSAAYTWKTAFDSEYAKFSPGALLVDRITDQLFSGDGIETIDSCSPEGGFMTQLWEGRRATVDLLADVRGANSLDFTMAILAERGRAQLRSWRDKLRAASFLPAPRRKDFATAR